MFNRWGFPANFNPCRDREFSPAVGCVAMKNPLHSIDNLIATHQTKLTKNTYFVAFFFENGITLSDASAQRFLMQKIIKADAP